MHSNTKGKWLVLSSEVTQALSFGHSVESMKNLYLARSHCPCLFVCTDRACGDVVVVPKTKKKIVHTAKLCYFSPLGLGHAVRSHAVEGYGGCQGILKRTRVAVAQHVPLIDIIRFHVGGDAALLTACGHGIPGVRARDAEYHNKPERCVLH